MNHIFEPAKGMKEADKVVNQKALAINSFLNGEYVLLHVATSFPDLIVPDYLKDKSSVTLKISQYFVGKMEVLSDRIQTDLLFNGKYFSCTIPFEAIWGISGSGGENILWPEVAPQDILDTIVATHSKTWKKEKVSRVGLSDGSTESVKKQKTHLKLIKR